jgi:hypothetical protein
MRRWALLTILCAASCSSESPPAGDATLDRRLSDAPAPAVEGPRLDHGGPFGDAPRRDGAPLAKDQGPPPVCPPNPLAAGDHPMTIAFGGHTREYTLHVPT